MEVNRIPFDGNICMTNVLSLGDELNIVDINDPEIT